MSARYLIRLDDACDTMDRRRWERVERVLDAHGVKPIVAVIPDNRDSALMLEARDAAFWTRVRGWVSKDWTVAMHGCTHLMHAIRRQQLLLPFYPRSEFAGLPLEAQGARIRAAWNLFLAQQVAPKVWVAPAHSFDLLTLEAVRRETSIRVVSDGIAWDTYHEHGFAWIPQQLWRLAERPSGLWTVCLHPNRMDDAAIGTLDRTLGGRFRGRVIRVSEVTLRQGGKTLLGRLYHRYFWWRWRRTHRAQ
jgi:predicted deacetylase